MSGPFPFAAVTGMERVRQALLLLATDPGLKGVLIEAGPGRAKSLLARGFAALVGAPVTEAPCGVTEDRLLGGLHLERTLATGARHAAPGLLARAHAGYLYVDESNLLDPAAARHIAHALDAGVVRLEREGISAAFPAGFAFIGTYDPSEGAVDAALAEAAGMRVCEDGLRGAAQRAEMLERMAAWHRDPAAFARQWAGESDALRERIARARRLLSGVAMAPAQIRRLLGASNGHRADLFAVRCARAHAALMERARVEEEDLAAAMQLVLAPRVAPREPAPPPAQAGVDRAAAEGNGQQRGEDVNIPPADCRAPGGALDGVQGAKPGRRRQAAAGTCFDRGRYIRAVEARPGARRIALAATLTAAARRTGALRIEKQDLRFKQFRRKAGVLAIFTVDASGSMAHSRMELAKGALIRLLERAYIHRDEVALIAFRGGGAEVLLPPTRGVERARRALENLAVGGGTPLAAGLRAALEMATRNGKASRALVVLLTDGRANVGAPEELEHACAAVRAAAVASLVIDSRGRFAANGETERLARRMGARHVFLGRPAPVSIYSVVAEAAEGLRHGA